MLDIKWIRDNPDALDAALAKRGAAPQSTELLRLDTERRKHLGALQELQGRRNEASKAIGKAKGRWRQLRSRTIDRRSRGDQAGNPGR